MGQGLRGSATTTGAVRRADQACQKSVKAAAKGYCVSPTIAQKCHLRRFSTDAQLTPKEPRSSVLCLKDEGGTVAFRPHNLVPLDQCLYSLHRSYGVMVSAVCQTNSQL